MNVQRVVRRWEPGDVAVLCTDGLSDHLGRGAIAGVVLDAPDLGLGAQRLVERAIHLGGGDNVTVVLLRRMS